MVFSEKLYKLRKKAGLSQKELAEKLGVAQASINYWEKGQRTPSIDMVTLIADYFEVSLDYLTGIENSEENNYYLNSETTKIAQDIFENKELRLLFDAARDAEPEDLETVHNMLLALKRKELRKEE